MNEETNKWSVTTTEKCSKHTFPHMHIHTHTHSLSPPHMHTHIHTHIHTESTHKYTQAHPYIPIDANTLTDTPTDANTQTLLQMQTHSQTLLQMQTHSQTLLQMHTHPHSHRSKQMHKDTSPHHPQLPPHNTCKHTVTKTVCTHWSRKMSPSALGNMAWV